MKYHYTYSVTNKLNGKSYIGVRSSNVKPNEDIGVLYFTSSTDLEFKEDFKNNTSFYKIHVIKIFNTREQAHMHEIELHEKYSVAENSNFYNKAKATSTKFSIAGTNLSKEHRLNISKSSKGRKLSKETRLKMSKAQKGLKKSKEHRENLSKSVENRRRGKKHHMYGKTHTDEAKKKIGEASKNRRHTPESKAKLSKALSGSNNGNYGRNFTKEHRKKISESKKGSIPANKGKSEKKVICPYCNKEGGNNAMKRWHFNNCKNITDK